MTVHRYDACKRLFDLVAALLAMVVLLPVLLVVAAVVLVALGRPVFFRQLRPGRYGRPFVLVKFRTMRHVDEARGLVSDADRLTALGRALRSTSLDELPTLWNVVRGQMSLVGPRPLLMRYLDRYTPEQARRHDVRPGITGLAQIRGRNGLEWQQKFAFDVWYVDHRCLAVDLHILAKTVGSVLRREGVSAPGSATTREYLGPRTTLPGTSEPAR